MIRRSVLGLCLFATSLVGADISGIWVGQDAGRRGEPQDLAFRFTVEGQVLKGKMFGDEFDLPITDGSLSADQVRFTVTTRNYYSGSKTVFIYTGTVKDGEMELTRERVPTPDDKAPNRAGPPKMTIKLKRIT